MKFFDLFKRKKQPTVVETQNSVSDIQNNNVTFQYNSETTIEEVLSYLKNNLDLQSIFLREPASEKEIEIFEKTVTTLPKEFKTLYRFSNGFESNIDMFQLISLNDIINNGKDKFLLTNNCFHFAEYMIYSDMWSIEIDVDDENKYRIYNEMEDIIFLSNSLAEFLSFFIKGGLFDGLYKWQKDVEDARKIAMTENEAFIYQSIFNQVRMGFKPIKQIKENIIDEIQDNGFDKEISEKWAYNFIEQEYLTLFAESKLWPQPNNTTRLIKAFDELCESNIIALHNAGYTTSDGEYEVVEVEGELRGNNMSSDGYCFYHEQDLCRAIATENSALYIAFQKVNNSSDDITIEIGKRVCNILKNNGFEIEWNETATSKILIPNFKWQLLYSKQNRDLQDYRQVIKRMTR